MNNLNIKLTEAETSNIDVNDQSVERTVQDITAEIGKALLGKEHEIRLALCCLFSRGHLLIEDLPGMGKTTLSHALASVLGLDFKRIQFTSDLLPADILGYSVFDNKTSEFYFHEGPIFTQLLLADEINRTTPKTQSALLEAMAECQVTIDGVSRPLGDPFFVIATQNPSSQSGTYALPESQLDRFLMRITIGYPDPDAERKILSGEARDDNNQKLNPCVTADQLRDISAQCARVKLSDALLDYVQRLIEFSRTGDSFDYGLSPRGAQALVNCARTWARMHGRAHVLPEDIQAVLPSVATHRFRATAPFQGNSPALVEQLLSQVAVIG